MQGTVWAWKIVTLDRFGLLLVFGAGLTYHIIANVFNSYYDWQNGLDQPGDGKTVPVLVDPSLGAPALYKCGQLFLLIGLLFAVVLALFYGPGIFLISILGLAGGYYYTAPPISYKYRGFSLPGVFVLMGLLLPMSAYLVQTGTWDWTIIWLSVPTACLIAAILQGNEMRDEQPDRFNQITTLTVATSSRVGLTIYQALILAPYVLVLSFIVIELVPLPTSLVFLTLIPARGLLIQARQGELQNIDKQTAKLHAIFGLLFLLGFVL